jgi:hypothetical protein
MAAAAAPSSSHARGRSEEQAEMASTGSALASSAYPRIRRERYEKKASAVGSHRPGRLVHGA